MKGLKGRYESHHKVLIRDEALEAAVSMSERYITDRNLPDKAIDVLDESCSKVSLKGYKVPENLTALDLRLKELEKQKEESTERAGGGREKIGAAKKTFSEKNIFFSAGSDRRRYSGSCFRMDKDPGSKTCGKRYGSS